MAEELLKRDLMVAIWNKDEIWNETYETKVTHAEADYIDNEGLGCTRLDEVDPDGDDYDPEETETIRISVNDYVEDNYKKDFLEYVNLDDINKGKHSSEDIESFINESINSLCEWFRTFTIMGDPFNDEYYIYLEISGGDYITLQDLNPEWTDDEYKLDDEILADYIDDIM